MLKNKKILLSLGVAAVTAVPIFAIVSFSVNKNGQFIYDGKRFSSEESLMSYLTDQNIAKMNQVKVFGELASSYAYYEKGLLNKNLLPDYDPSSTHLAYFKAGGSITQDFEDARRSYYNPGRVVPKYEDGWGGTYHSSSAAAQSFRDKIIDSAEGYKEVNFINGNSSSLRKINPLNASDVEQLKNNISDNFQEIIMDQFTDDKNLGYKIELDPNAKIKETDLNDLTFGDLASTKKQVINKKIDSSWQIDQMETGHWLFEDDYSALLTIKLGEDTMIQGNYYPWYTIPSGQPVYWVNDESRQSWYWSVNAKLISARDDTHFVPREETVNIPSNTAPDVLTKLKGLSRAQMEKLLSPEKGVANLYRDADSNSQNNKLHLYNQATMKSIESIDETSKSGAATVKNEIANPFSYLKQKIQFFKNDNRIENFFSQKHMLNNADVKLETKYDVKSMPIPIVKRSTDVDTTIFGIHTNEINHVEIPSQTLTWDVDVSNVYSLDRGLESRSVFDKDIFSKIVYNLSSQGKYADGLPIVIKDKVNDDILFSATIKMTDDKTISFAENKGLEVDNNEFNYSEKINGTESKQEPLFAKLSELYEAVNVADASFATMKKKLEEIINLTSVDSFGNIGGPINNQTNFSIFFKQLKTLVDAHDSDPDMVKKTLLENIKKQIPNPKDILFFRNDKSNLSDKNEVDLTIDNVSKYTTKKILRLTKYLISSPSEFNSPLASGRYSETKINSDADLIKLKDSLSKFTPTETLTAYDADGMPLNKDYIYDREDLLEYNSIMSIEPRRDFAHIYIDGHNNPISNEVHSIYHLQYKGVDLYFDTFAHLRTYLFEEILKKEITWI